MGYELTEIDIGNLFRILVGKTRTFEGDVRSWFATLPVVAATDVERPAPSGPDPLAEPTEEEVELACERYWEFDGNTDKLIRHLLTDFVADRRKSAPPHAPEPAPTAADYMVYQPDRIEFRAKGDGQHDPVVATVTAEGLLAAMRAAGAVEERGGEA